MIDTRRFATVLAVGLLTASLVAFGVPYVDYNDGTPETTTYDEHAAVQEGDALLPAVAAGAAVALSAGTAGTVIGAGYFDDDVDSQSQAYYSAQNLVDRTETDYKNLNSSLEETRTMAYRVAESEFAREMANDSTKSEAQTAADEAVTQYMVDVLEDEFVRRNNAYVSTIASIDDTEGVDVDTSSGGGAAELSYWELEVYAGSSESRTFNVSSFGGSWVEGDGDNPNYEIDFDDSDYETLGWYGYHLAEMKELWGDYEDIRAEVTDEIETFADEVDEEEFEDLDPDDITSPITQATEFGEDYNDTGTSGYAGAMAQSLGYDTSDIGTTYQVEMTPQSGNWYNGSVYADADTIDNATLEVGETYDGSEITAWVALDGEAETVELDDEFHIHGIETQDGEEVNETELSTWSRQELDADAPTQTLQDWQDTVANASGLGSGLFGGGFFGGEGFLNAPFDDAPIPGGNAVHLGISAIGIFGAARILE